MKNSPMLQWIVQKGYLKLLFISIPQPMSQQVVVSKAAQLRTVQA